MRIGFDAKRLFCNFTGLGNYSRTLVRNIANAYPSNRYFLYSPKATKEARTNFFFSQVNYQVFIAKTFFKSFWRSFFILKQLKKDQIDLYHGLSHELPIGIQKSSIKSVVTIHDLIFKVYPKTYSAINRTIYDWKFNYSCQHADTIIAISEHTKKDIIHHYNIPSDKIKVVYQACQTLYYQMAPRDRAVLKKYAIPSKYILSVGTIQKRKNLKLLIKAYELLPPTLRLPIVVVGNGGTYKQETIELVQKAQLQDSVLWIGNLNSDEELQQLYQAAQLLVYPSFYEGFGLPIVEALLSKTPVITSNTSALIEAGGPHSIYIDPLDEKALAIAIETVLVNPDLAENMRTKGFEYAHQMFNPQLLSQQLMDCYQQTIE